MRRGNALIAAGGEPIELVEDPYGVLRDPDPGDEFRIEFARDGRKPTRTVRLAGRPG